ncbi:MAG: S1C family serine protease [Chthoniobacterales bacterium]
MSRLVFDPFRLRILRLGLCGLSLGLLAGRGVAQDAVGKAPADEVIASIAHTVRDILHTTKDAIVRVEWEDPKGLIRCTGFYIDAMGTLYSPALRTADTQAVYIVKDGKRTEAEVLVNDPRCGIALLRSKANNTSFLRLGKKAPLEIASPVLVIGYPMDLDLSPGFGLISGFDKKFGGVYFPTTHIRANIPVQRGEAGAPLLDMQGRVVGIVISSVDGGATCYALPIAAAEKVHYDFKRYGEVRPGWLGVKVEKLKGAESPNPLTVVAVLEPNGPAAKAGLRVGDLVVRLGERKIKQPEDVLDASFFLTSEESAEIEILRNGTTQTLRVTPGIHPSTRTGPLQQAGLQKAFP